MSSHERLSSINAIDGEAMRKGTYEGTNSVFD